MAIDYAGITIAADSDDATDKGSVSIVPVIGATEEGPRTCKYGGVGCPVNSLKEAPVPQQTQTASASLPATEGHTAQSSRSDDDGTQFQIAHRTSAPDSSVPAPPTDP